MKIFFHFIEISINNSFIIYKKIINPKITNLKFRKQLSKELISYYLGNKNGKPKKEKFFTDCKLAKINESKDVFSIIIKMIKKHLIFVKLVG